MEQADWVMRYESMRALVTGEAIGGSPVRGLAIFLRHGLAGWMCAWQRLPSSLPKSREKIRSGVRKNDDLVSLLLEMAIRVLQPGNSPAWRVLKIGGD